MQTYLVGLNHGAPSAVQSIREALVVDATLLLGAVLDGPWLLDIVPGCQPSPGSFSGGSVSKLHAGASVDEDAPEDLGEVPVDEG